MSENLVTREVVDQRRAAELEIIAAAKKLLELQRNAAFYGLGQLSLGCNSEDSNLRALLYGAKVLSELDAQDVRNPASTR